MMGNSIICTRSPKRCRPCFLLKNRSLTVFVSLYNSLSVPLALR